MIETAKLYYFYHNFTVQLLKLLLVIVALLILFLNQSNTLILHICIFILSYLVIFETFFHFKIAKTLPPHTVFESNLLTETFTIYGLYPFITKGKFESSIKEIFKMPQVRYMLEKADIDQSEIKLIVQPKEDVASLALQIVKKIGGKYVTSCDIAASYLLSCESKTKLLFSKGLKEEDMYAILFFVRNLYSKEEQRDRTRAVYKGLGVGEILTTGWTIETKKFTFDRTFDVLKQGKVNIGREKEYIAIEEALEQVHKNSLILVGDVGVGKQTLIYSFFSESFYGRVPSKLAHKRLYELLIDILLAGVQNQGELEIRLKNIIDELSHSGNVILYIPNIENILGAQTFELNVAGTLLPYLQDSKFQIIATTTPGNYKKYIEENKSILDVLEVLFVKEPDEQNTIQMLLHAATFIERQEKLLISYKAVLRAYQLAKKYERSSVFPGAGVTLLEETASFVSTISQAPKVDYKKIVTEADIEKKVEDKSGIAISLPTQQEKKLLLNFEEQLHKRVIGQDEAINKIAQAMRRLREGLNASSKPISFLFLGPTGVGKTETAKTLASVYFKGEHAMIRLDMSEYKGEEGIEKLLGAAPGKGDERGQLTDKVFDNPSSLILLDEFEKADREVLNLFLQVLDDGRLTDSKGRVISFANTIIIATSNAGSEYIRESIEKGIKIDNEFTLKLLNFLQTQEIFKPELLNRFDAIVEYKPLTTTELKEVVKLLLQDTFVLLKQKDITLTYDESVVDLIVKEGSNEQFGARPLKRYIEDSIENLIAKNLLENKLKRGDNVFLSVSSKGEVVANVK